MINEIFCKFCKFGIVLLHGINCLLNVSVDVSGEAASDCTKTALEDAIVRLTAAAAAVAEVVGAASVERRCRAGSGGTAAANDLRRTRALVAWHSGRTAVSSRRTFPVLRSTYSWWVAATVGKPSAAGQPTQPFILLGLINRVPALIGCGKGGNVTFAGWQVTLCDPIWHVSSRSSEAFVNCYIRVYFALLTWRQITRLLSYLATTTHL